MTVIGQYISEDTIQRFSDGRFVPVAEGNRDYDALMAEVAQGAVVEPWTPPAPVPEPLPPLTPRQLRLMLLMIDMSEADVEQAIEAITDPVESAAAMIEWRWATQYERDHWLVAQLAAALEFEPHEVDSLWTAAATL